MYWIGITSQIQDIVKACEHCQKYQKTQRHEPLVPTPLPDRPWQQVAADLCEFDGHTFLIVVDYYSRFMEISKLQKITSDVVKELKVIYARFGIPEVLVTDNGPQFASAEFKMFVSRYGFSHVTSSPYHPQANGAAERAVQTAKCILRQDDPELALMSYRSTPTSSTEFSPSQLLKGREIRTTLPQLARQLQPKWPEHAVVRNKDGYAKEQQIPLRSPPWGALSTTSTYGSVGVDQDRPRENMVRSHLGDGRCTHS